MHYRSVEQLNRLVNSWVSTGGAEPFDVVVGIPRSGMLPASLIALAAHLPLTDLGAAIAGQAPQGGLRAPVRGQGRQRLLVVDDTVSSGTNMRAVRETLAASGHVDLADVTTLAVFASPHGRPFVDLALESVPWPRVFEWNALHQPQVLATACLDADDLFWPDRPGLLCRRGSSAGPDHGYCYRPSRAIGTLVAEGANVDVDRVHTWLVQNAVDVGELVLVESDRAKATCCSTVAAKAAVYRSRSSSLFYESHYCRAVGIANAAGRPVYWTSGGRMIYPGSTQARPRLTPRRQDLLAWGLRRVRRWATVRSGTVGRRDTRHQHPPGSGAGKPSLGG